MSFGGGGGAVGVSAHKHTNASGEGGSLDSTTQINNGSLFALMVGM